MPKKSEGDMLAPSRESDSTTSGSKSTTRMSQGIWRDLRCWGENVPPILGLSVLSQPIGECFNPVRRFAFDRACYIFQWYIFPWHLPKLPIGSSRNRSC